MWELLARLKAVMVTPQTEWPVVAAEPNDAPAIRYIAVVALVPALARLAGGWLIGGYLPLLPALAGAVVAYLLSFASVFVVALAIDRLAPRFKAQRGYSGALRLTAYSFTPVWLAGVMLLVPGASFLVLLGLYGIYLMWTGMPVLMQSPAEKALPYALAAAGCAIACDIALRLVLSAAVAAVR